MFSTCPQLADTAQSSGRAARWDCRMWWPGSRMYQLQRTRQHSSQTPDPRMSRAGSLHLAECGRGLVGRHLSNEEHQKICANSHRWSRRQSWRLAHPGKEEQRGSVRRQSSQGPSPTMLVKLLQDTIHWGSQRWDATGRPHRGERR
jgi:hypothetical protein